MKTFVNDSYQVIYKYAIKYVASTIGMQQLQNLIQFSPSIQPLTKTKL